MVFSIVTLLSFSPCAAENAFLQQPNIEYSADEIMEVGNIMTVRSKVFYAPGKIRKDQSMEGTQNISIIRQDKNLVWMLMPKEKMYIEMPIAKGKGLREDMSGDFTKNTVVQSVLGEEILNGVKATKNKVTVKDPGGEYEGFIWQSKNGIIVKMELTPKRKNSAETIKVELKNIRQEPQDPTLFEIPRGYTRMDMLGLSGLMK